jgi:hypothetical protein
MASIPSVVTTIYEVVRGRLVLEPANKVDVVLNALIQAKSVEVQLESLAIITSLPGSWKSNRSSGRLQKTRGMPF